MKRFLNQFTKSKLYAILDDSYLLLWRLSSKYDPRFQASSQFTGFLAVFSLPCSFKASSRFSGFRTVFMLPSVFISPPEWWQCYFIQVFTIFYLDPLILLIFICPTTVRSLLATTYLLANRQTIHLAISAFVLKIE